MLKAWKWQKFCPFCGSMRCHRTIGTLLIKTALRGEASEPPHLRQRPGEVPSRSLHRGSPQTCTPTCHQVTTRPGTWPWPQEGELPSGCTSVSLQLAFVKPIAFPSLCFSVSVLPSFPCMGYRSEQEEWDVVWSACGLCSGDAAGTESCTFCWL